MYADNEIVWWQPRRKRRSLYRRLYNVGDLLSPFLCDAILATRGRGLDPARRPPHRLLAIGSILHLAADGDVVWGAGVNGKVALDHIRARRLDVRAVRGPRSAAVLRGMGIDVPDVFGDPGLLVSRFLPLHEERRHAVAVVPHFNQRWPRLRWPGRRIVSPRLGVADFCRALGCSRLVVSSSLHGLVVAESYGVPAVFWDNGSGEDLFKYRDYYEGTGRPEFPRGRTIAECLALGGAPPPRVDLDRLLAAFPFDHFAAPQPSGFASAGAVG